MLIRGSRRSDARGCSLVKIGLDFFLFQEEYLAEYGVLLVFTMTDTITCRTTLSQMDIVIW